MTLAPELVATPAPAAHLSPRRDRADVVVIGGGAVGLATAVSLARDGGASVVVVEAEERVARHQTGNNSGVMHSGLYYKPGSYKARFCAAGRDAMYAFCREHGIAHDPCGKVVVATSDAEIPALDELARRGTANGLAGLRRLTGEELREYEPHVAGIAGLHVRETQHRRLQAGRGQVRRPRPRRRRRGAARDRVPRRPGRRGRAGR